MASRPQIWATQSRPLSTRDFNEGLARLSTFPTSADGMLHLRRRRNVVKVTRARVAGAASLLWLTGRRTGEILTLTRSDIEVRGDSLMITWPPWHRYHHEGRPPVTGTTRAMRWAGGYVEIQDPVPAVPFSPPVAIEYPADEYTKLACERVVELIGSLPLENGTLFPGRSHTYTLAGMNALAGRASVTSVWLWLRSIYAGWSPSYLRLSSAFRIWAEGGLSLMRERTGATAQTEKGTGNRYIIAASHEAWLRDHPKPIFVHVPV
jgi:hypothetical protein